MAGEVAMRNAAEAAAPDGIHAVDALSGLDLAFPPSGPAVVVLLRHYA